jgi:voltage-gated potassium channel
MQAKTGVRANAHSSGMPRGRGRSFLTIRTERAVVNRRVFPYLALVTLALGLLAGFLVTLVDKKDFPTFGDGVWWAIVTLGTVGYGDIVPHTAWGRVVGSVVIVFGVTFIAFLTATVTSAFVSAAEQPLREEQRQREEAAQEETLEQLRLLKTQLDAIEAKLDGHA